MKFGRQDYDKRIVDLEERIPSDEPVFFLRGNDQFAPKLLLMWATELRLAGGDPAMARSAEDHAQAMLMWQKVHGVKTPDMYKDSEEKKYIKHSIEGLLSAPRLDFKKLIKLVSDYKDDDGYKYVMVLMPSDLKSTSASKSATEVGYDDFDLSDDDQTKAYKASLIIYQTTTTYRVLKNEL